MNTKIASIVMGGILLTGMYIFGVEKPLDAKAEDLNPKINTVQDLEKELSELDDTNYESLSENDKEEVIKEVLDSTSESVKSEIFNKAEEAIRSNSELGYNSEEIANDIEVFTNATDISEEKSNSPITMVSETLTKAYGNRLYNVTAGINIKGVGAYVRKLGSHYTIADNGLTMRYVETDGTYIVLGTVSHSGKILDKRAEKVGYNINGYGKYHANVNILGQPLVDLSGSITSTIKLKSLNKSTKKAVVVQSFTMK